jgi:MFS family permease
MMLIAMYGGVLADRLDKRLMLLVTQCTFGLLALGMGLLVVSGAAQLWHVYVFALLFGTCQAFDTPTRQAFVPEMVGPEGLPNAVSLNSATFNSARLIGPGVGGLLIAAFGVGPLFLVNGSSYLAVIAGLLLMRPGELHRGRRAPRARGQIAAAVTLIRGRPDLLQAFLLVFVVGTMGMNFMLTLPLLARIEFKVDAARFGLLGSALAAGALCAALAGSRRRARPSAWIHFGFAGLFGVLETVLALAPSFLVAALIVIPTGAALIAHNNVANQRVQLGVPAQIRGRIMALYMMVFVGGTPLGGLFVGAVSQRYGARVGIALGGVSVLLAAAAIALLEARRERVRVSIDLLPRPALRVSVPGAAGGSSAAAGLDAEPGRAPEPVPGVLGDAPAALAEAEARVGRAPAAR